MKLRNEKLKTSNGTVHTSLSGRTTSSSHHWLLFYNRPQ